MNESISTAAGAPHGHFLSPSKMRAAIRAAGRIPAERATTYRLRQVFECEPNYPEPLDIIEAEASFGSYHTLIASPEFRFKKAIPNEKAATTQSSEVAAVCAAKES